MNFDLSNCSKRSIINKMVDEIAGNYLKKLNNSFIFEAKLGKLTVIPFDIPVSKPYAFIRIKPNSIEYSMVLVYNSKKLNKKDVAFTIAHELAHLLIFDPTDCAKKCRINIDLEEALADYLAYYILSDMNYVNKNSGFEKRCNTEIPKQKRNVIAEFELLFGKSLFECEKIDEISKNHKKSNFLWYDIVTFNLKNIKCIYRKKTGKSLNEFQDSLKTLFH